DRAGRPPGNRVPNSARVGRRVRECRRAYRGAGDRGVRGVLMPSALVVALGAPIREVQALVGPGWSSDSVSTLMGARDTLSDVSASVRRAWVRTEASWSGAGADAAAEFAAATAAAVDALAMRAERLGAVADSAGSAVDRARERLRNIVGEFEARAASLEPYLESPGVAERLMAEARRSLEDAVAVVDERRAELDGHAATLGAPAPPSVPA